MAESRNQDSWEASEDSNPTREASFHLDQLPLRRVFPEAAVAAQEGARTRSHP
jgi:hypothetical protein